MPNPLEGQGVAFRTSGQVAILIGEPVINPNGITIDPFAIRKAAVTIGKEGVSVGEKVARLAEKQARNNLIKEFVNAEFDGKITTNLTIVEVSPNGRRVEVQVNEPLNFGVHVLPLPNDRFFQLQIAPAGPRDIVPVRVGISGFEGFNLGRNGNNNPAFVRNGLEQRVVIGERVLGE